MYRPLSRQRSEAMAASGIADSHCLHRDLVLLLRAAGSGWSPESFVPFMLVFICVECSRALHVELERDVLCQKRGLVCRAQVLPDEPPGLEKHEKSKKATHLQVLLLKKTPSAAEVLRFSTHEGGPNLQRRASAS